MTAGKVFDESRPIAVQIQNARGYHYVPSFHRDLVRGVATYALELFTGCADLDVVYVSIGVGSGICGLIAVRDLLSLKIEIVGMVAENAPAFACSFETGRTVQTELARTFANRMACRDPPTEALEIIKKGAARVVTVSEDPRAEAIRVYFTATHNLAEGGRRRAACRSDAGNRPICALAR